MKAARCRARGGEGRALRADQPSAWAQPSAWPRGPSCAQRTCSSWMSRRRPCRSACLHPGASRPRSPPPLRAFGSRHPAPAGRGGGLPLLRGHGARPHGAAGQPPPVHREWATGDTARLSGTRRRGSTLSYGGKVGPTSGVLCLASPARERHRLWPVTGEPGTEQEDATHAPGSVAVRTGSATSPERGGRDKLGSTPGDRRQWRCRYGFQLVFDHTSMIVGQGAGPRPCRAVLRA